MADVDDILTAKMEKKIKESAASVKALMTQANLAAEKMLPNSKHFAQFAKRTLEIKGKITAAQMKGDKKTADYLEKRLGEMALEIANPKDLRELSKGLATATETFGDGMHSAFQAIKGKDMASMASMFKKMGTAASAAGAKMETTTKTGGMGKATEGLGKVLSTIGPAVAAIAGAAMGIVALIKIVMDADSRIKDMNKSMIEAGISGQEFGDDVGKGMDRMRDAFSGTGALDYLNEFGTTTKENIQIMGAFQKSGMTFTKLVGDTNNAAEATGRLRDAAKGAVVYSKLLGETSEKVAGDMAKMAEETATTLEGVRSKFSEIAAASKQAGFDTKRFYGMVLEVTSGMSMYNVRLQDTIGLLTQAGKVLGPDAGKAWAMSLKGHGEESSRDRAVNVMKMGKGTNQKVAKEDAKAQVGALKNSFMDIQKSGTAGQQKGLAEALAKVGITDVAGMSSEDMAKQMGKMSLDQSDILRADLNKVKGTLGTKTAGAVAVARAGEGGGLGTQAYGMKNFGQVGTLMTKVMGAHGVSAKTDFDKLSTDDLIGNIASESLKTGAGAITSDDANMLRDAIGQLKSEGSKVTMEGIMKKLGIAQKTSDKEAKNAEDRKKLQENAWEDDQILAGQVRDNTYSMADKLDNMMEQYLSTIAQGVLDIVAWLPGTGGQKDKDKAAKRAALDESQNKIDSLNKDLKDASGPGKEGARKAIRERIANENAIKRGISLDTTTMGGKGDFRKAAELGGSDDKAAMEKEKKDAEAAAFAKKEGTLNKMTTMDKVMDFMGGGGGTTGLSQADQADATYLDEVKKANDEIEKKYQDKQKKIDKKLYDEQTKDELKGIAKIMDDIQKSEDIGKALVAAGVTDPMAAGRMAKQIQDGGAVDAGPWGSQLKKVLKDRSSPVQMQDGTLTYEGGGRREFAAIDDADTVSIHKPGGALSKAGGGGSITVNVNQWGDVPKAVETALRALRI